MKNKKVVLRVCGWIGVWLLAVIIATHLGRSAVKGQESTAIMIAFTCLVVAFVFRFGWRKGSQSKTARFIPWVSVPIMLTALWAVNTRLFGKFDVGASLFHLSHSIQYDGLGEDIAEFTLFLFLGVILIFCVQFLGRRDRRIRWMDKAVFLPILLINPLSSYVYDSYLNPSLKAVSLLDYYAPPDLPVLKKKPDASKKNVILIYLESIEDTYRAPVFEGAYTGIGEIAKQGVRFDGVTQVQDTGWTIAGIVSSQCGIPLLSYGLIMRNRMKNIDTFLPGATCLADVLRADGYQTVYYGGANLNFSGKGTFLKTHGYQDVRGTLQFAKDKRGEIGEWGLHDDVLFDLALARVEEMDKQEEPYLFSMLSMSAHFPVGYPAPECYKTIDGAEQMDSILLSIRCAGFLTERFLSRADEKGLLDNTIVVILSDHLGHRNTQFGKLRKLQRQNTAMILGSDQGVGDQTVNGAMFDIFPTILDALGYDLPKARAGIGVSLLSEEPTLLEQLGAKKIDKVILRDKSLRSIVWQVEVANDK